MELKPGMTVRTKRGLTLQLDKQLEDGRWLGYPLDEAGQKMFNFVRSKLITRTIKEEDIVNE